MMKQRISIFLLFTLLLFANGYAQKRNHASDSTDLDA